MSLDGQNSSAVDMTYIDALYFHNLFLFIYLFNSFIYLFINLFILLV